MSSSTKNWFIGLGAAIISAIITYLMHTPIENTVRSVGF